MHLTTLPSDVTGNIHTCAYILLYTHINTPVHVYTYLYYCHVTSRHVTHLVLRQSCMHRVCAGRGNVGKRRTRTSRHKVTVSRSADGETEADDEDEEREGEEDEDEDEEEEEGDLARPSPLFPPCSFASGKCSAGVFSWDNLSKSPFFVFSWGFLSTSLFTFSCDSNAREATLKRSTTVSNNP